MKTSFFNSPDFEHISEFDDHCITSFVSDEKSGLRGFIAVHRSNNGKPSFGATRMWNFLSEEEALKDALRLSRMMSYKSALAGLPYGGAKGTIIIPKNLRSAKRNNILKSYAERVGQLRGLFITGTDVGLDREDVELMNTISPYFVGHTSNPTEFTALGLLLALKTCLKNVYGNDDLQKRSIAIQGVGKIGSELLRLIYKDFGTIYITDINKKSLKKINKRFPKTIVVPVRDIHKKKVDIFSPCALGNVLSTKTISKLNCNIIVGGANNQLKSPEIGKVLHRLGILYAPDYIVNAGGLISVVDEYENKRFSKKRILNRINTIGDNLESVLRQSAQYNKPASIIADRMAEKIFN